MPQKKMLLRTIHGSHLYGLNTATSDRDFYEIYDYPWQRYRPRKQNQQVIDKHRHDTTMISLERFTDLCIKGVPQSIEVLFTDSSKWLGHDESWYHKSNEVKSIVADNIPTVLETYKRTAWNFFLPNNFKKNRHALRLCLNALDLKTKGFFNPTLTFAQREELNKFASLPRLQQENTFKDVFYEIFGDI